MGLKGKKILIIGGSSGIGKETAVQLSRSGAKVLIAARREEKLQEVLSMLEGDGHQYLTADMSHVETVENLFRTVKEEFGPLDGLLYTAGVGATVPVSILKPEKLNEIMTVHFFSFVEAVRQFAKKGRFTPGARITAVSSVAAKCGDKGHTAYSSAKAAVEAAVRCMAMELADKKIYINTIAPGMTKTEMMERFLIKNGEDGSGYDKVCERQYLGIGSPQDVANVICFLLSPLSGFISGAVIPVDGGYTSC